MKILRKLLIISLTISLCSFFIPTNEVKAQSTAACDVLGIEYVKILPTNTPTPDRTKIGFEVKFRNTTPRSVYIFFNYQYSTATGVKSDLPFSHVFINDTGTGVSEYPLPLDTYNGTYTLTVALNQSGTDVCVLNTAPDLIINGRKDPPTGDCLKEGDACIPGATDSKICDSFNFYCGYGTYNTYVVTKRSCNIGGGCCKTIPPPNLNDPIQRPVYTCQEGKPSSQSDSCQCELDIKAKPSHDSLCTDNKSINTALGCAPIDSSTSLATFILRRAIGIAGGVAFILFVAGALQYLTSQANVQKIESGTQLMTAAVVGLLFLIFAILILRTIGIDILGILT